MTTTDLITTADLAQQVIATLRAHEAELRAAGIRRLSVFGSVARGDAEADSDVDLAVEFEPDARMDLFRLVGLEAAHRLGERAAQRVPDQPWGEIRGLGNRLRHAYHRINSDIVWNTASERLPTLKVDALAALRRLRGDIGNSHPISG